MTSSCFAAQHIQNTRYQKKKKKYTKNHISINSTTEPNCEWSLPNPPSYSSRSTIGSTAHIPLAPWNKVDNDQLRTHFTRHSTLSTAAGGSRVLLNGIHTFVVSPLGLKLSLHWTHHVWLTHAFRFNSCFFYKENNLLGVLFAESSPCFQVSCFVLIHANKAKRKSQKCVMLEESTHTP